jgi:internalin A
MQKPTTHQALLRLIDQAADEGWEELDLSGLGLEELPPSIGKCTQLKKLLLSRTDWAWAYLGTADAVVGNQLATLPDAIANLSNLTEISLRKNCFTSIPEIVAKLPSLQRIDRTENQISQIPESMASLSHLAELLLASNQFDSIPEVVSHFQNLSLLDFSFNQITSIPTWINQLRNLKTFRLRNNRIPQNPDKTIEQRGQILRHPE